MKDRVLGKHGFEPFPKRLEEQAIKHGVKNAPADKGVKEPNIHSNAQAKQELALKMNEDAKKQAEMDKTIKERDLAKAKEEQAYLDAKKADEPQGDPIKAATDEAKAKAEASEIKKP